MIQIITDWNLSSSSNHADSMDFLDSLSLSIPIIILAGLLDYIKFLYRADLCKSTLVGQHRHIHNLVLLIDTPAHAESFLHSLEQAAGDISFMKFIAKVYKLQPVIGLLGRVFTNGLGDWGSIPGQVIPKTQKMISPCLTLSIMRYRSRVK